MTAGLRRVEEWLDRALAAPGQAEGELCLRKFEPFAKRAWAVVEEDTPLIWEPNAHAVMAQHIEALLHGFVRVKLHQLAQGYAHSQLPRVPTGRLPFGRTARVAELRERARLAHLWATGRRMEVMLSSGAVEYRPQPFTNLLINVGTGYGKSRLGSVLAPAYLWLLWPAAWVQAFSINGTGAATDAGRQRDLIRSRWFQETFTPWWQITLDKDAERYYRNTAGGGRRAVGWGAKTQGDRAHFQLIDDPEDPQEVYSDGQREATRRGWDGRIVRRVHPGGTSIRLALQQHLHEDDWSYHVLRTGLWEHLELATEAESTPSPCGCPTHLRGHTALGWKDTRAPGELLAPRLVPRVDVEARKASPIVFAAQDQQRPQKLTGNVFPPDRWRFWRFADQDAVPELADRTIIIPDKSEWLAYFEDRILTADLSFGVSQDGSWDCLGVWGKMGEKRLLLDVEWGPLTFTSARGAVRALLARVPGVGHKSIELAANGSAVINSLTEGAESLQQDPIEGIVPVLARENKVLRAISIQHLHHAGNLYLPLHHQYRSRMVSEAGAFPRKGVRNDFVDMLSHAQRHWQGTPFAMSL